jgi:hypothetical protein
MRQYENTKVRKYGFTRIRLKTRPKTVPAVLSYCPFLLASSVGMVYQASNFESETTGFVVL